MPYIFRKPVHVLPSMDSMGASKVPVIFGDFKYWVTRVNTDDPSNYVRVYRETNGLAEQGEVGLKFFGRYDGVLAYTGAAAHTPIGMIQNHS